MALSPKGGFSYHVVGEGSSEVVTNNNLFRSDSLIGGGIKILDRDLTAPPGSESEGDVYLIASGATGDWSGKSGKLACYTGSGYVYIDPAGGMRAFIVDEKIEVGYSSVESAWYPIQEIWSATEHWTGRYSRTGEKIYSKCLATGSLPNRTTSTVAHGITNLDIDNHVQITGYYYQSSTPSSLYMLPGYYIQPFLTSTNLSIYAAVDASAFEGYARLEYCKTA